MLMASLPLPSFAPNAVPDNTESWPFALLDRAGIPSAGQRLTNADQIGSARLQLAYPWIETIASAGLPEGVEAPEGVLMGSVASTALARGAFRGAAGMSLPIVRRTLPELGTAALRRGLDDGRADWLGDRLCMDGGICQTSTHSDVVAGVKRALIISLSDGGPQAVTQGLRTSGMPNTLQQEIRDLEAGDTRTMLTVAGLMPGVDRIDSIMDPKWIAPMLKYGHERGLAELPKVKALWA